MRSPAPPPAGTTGPSPRTPLLAALPPPLVQVRDLTVRFGRITACDGVGLELYPGEVLGIVGESGSGKSTLLHTIAGYLLPDQGQVLLRLDGPPAATLDLAQQPEAERRRLQRTTLGLVRQQAEAGLRMTISAGGNIAEPLLAQGERHYGRTRDTVLEWLRAVEIDPSRIDDSPRGFSGGMRQRLQLARVLVTRPPVVLMDEPTTGLDVSVQARLVDLIRRLVRDLDLSVVLVTHDLGIARILADRLAVMRHGRIVEAGLTDQILDDPGHPYAQALVASVMRA